MSTTRVTVEKQSSNKPSLPIKWFQEQAHNGLDAEAIRDAAINQKYSPSTISIQLGRLRAHNLLPKAKVQTGKKKNESAIVKPRKIRPVPKPGAA